MRMQRDTDGWRSKVATGREHATERASFKSALHETFYRSSKSIAELAELLGVSRQYLQAAADENEPDRHLSGRLFPALATHADNPAWLDHLEACHGRVAFVVPTQPNGQVARIVREFGEFLEALDGDTVVDIEREGREAIAAIAGEMARRRELRERR